VRGGRLLPTANLRQAMTWYRNAMHRHITPEAGIKGHCLRYGYAVDRIAAYVHAGDTRAEALAHTSVDLGHGDCRGKYVEAVYSR